jgi:uncharacterized protein (TIGR03085 family)
VTSPARTERLALCDLFVDLGPDAPTLLGDWTTRDLAAHLVMRERRPDAAPGAVVKALASYAERVRVSETERPWTELVELVRDGPPVWNPMRVPAIDTQVNSVEFFVHHEDVRRAQPRWTPRELPIDLEDALASSLHRMGRLLTRAAKGIGLVLRPPDRHEIRIRGGDPTVAISGPVGEGVLYLYGRKDVAGVSVDGPPAAVAQVAAAPFGL